MYQNIQRDCKRRLPVAAVEDTLGLESHLVRILFAVAAGERLS